MDTTTKQYAQLETRIKKGDLGALLARWAFGRKLLAERGDAPRLPNGRVEEIHRDCNTHVTVTGYRMELSRRMRFAEQYPTKASVRSAFREFGSWSAICARGMLTRDVIETLASPDHIARPPKWHPSSAFERHYYEVLGRIRSFLRTHSIEYRALWLTALQHGIEQEVAALERRHRATAESDTGLLKYAPTAP